MLVKVTTLCPLAIIFAVSMILTPKKKKLYVFYVSIVGLYISLGTCIFLTDILKNWIGRCRPDFLSRCEPDSSAQPDVLYYASEICTTNNTARLLDGFRTTPSGHSSMSFSSFGYTSFWLFGQLLVRHIHGGAWRSVVALLPSLYAAYIALSRTQDYRHHFVDVTLGSILGVLVGWWSYRRLFPTTDDPLCYVPYQLIEEKQQSEEYWSIRNRDFYDEDEVDGRDYLLSRYSHDLESQQHPSDLETSQLRAEL
ncbi:unnamed protein product [Ambrosiozyma monospora]|uniref:Unnamed protein product n=1 Tax=Ambrosiozyma monospora TaxID=43982 RepID=A0ACB5U1F3_AMBMO|nr:unnamed protein product [Ambrosiozyma monospora]